MTWADYDVAMADLAAKVAEADFAPDIILAIARGGLFPAGSLAYAMSIKNLYVMNMEYYTGVDERREVPVMLPPYLDTNDLSDSKVLVVDDVSDTGHTLQAVEDFCAKHVAEARSALRETLDRIPVRPRVETHRSLDRVSVVAARLNFAPSVGRL
jgi:hypoxanthine phosphoribosyltransferase